MALAAVVALVACATAAPPPSALPGAVRPEWGHPQSGDPAPDFDLVRTDRPGRLRLSSLRGSWVFLHFTATWCPFCDAEIGSLGKIADRFASRGLKVIVVDVKEPLDRWTEYAKTHVAPSVIALHDPTGEATKIFAPPGAQPSFTDRTDAMFDSSMLIDPKGMIRAFTIPDSAHFDPTFGAYQAEIDRLTSGGAGAAAAARGGEPAVPADGIVVRAVPAAPATCGPGARGELRLAFAIDEGFHVMSDAPSKANYIATNLTLDPVDGVTFDAAAYPPPTTFALTPDESIRTFVGRFEIRVQFAVAASASGARDVRGTLH